MKTTFADLTSQLEPTTVTRLLIVSYFIAIAIGLVAGAEVNRLATPFMSEDAARLLMRAIILTLCSMILFGVMRRPAALVLSLVVFWASYMTMYATDDVSAFWRDLALIGGLLMCAREAEDDDGLDHGLELNDQLIDLPAPAPTARKRSGLDDNAYREDLNLARVT